MHILRVFQQLQVLWSKVQNGFFFKIVKDKKTLFPTLVAVSTKEKEIINLFSFASLSKKRLFLKDIHWQPTTCFSRKNQAKQDDEEREEEEEEKQQQQQQQQQKQLEQEKEQAEEKEGVKKDEEEEKKKLKTKEIEDEKKNNVKKIEEKSGAGRVEEPVERDKRKEEEARKGSGQEEDHNIRKTDCSLHTFLSEDNLKFTNTNQREIHEKTFKKERRIQKT